MQAINLLKTVRQSNPSFLCDPINFNIRQPLK
jgi:hypothetical protein